MQLQLNQLTADLRAIIDRAQHEAAHRHTPYVDVEHLALGILHHPAGTAHALFEQHGVDTSALYQQIAAAVGTQRDEPIEIKGYTKWATATLQRAVDEAQTHRHVPLAAGHLLIALMRETEGAVCEAFGSLPFDAAAIGEYLNTVRPPKLSDNAPPLAPVPQFKRTSTRSGSEQAPEIIIVPTRAARQRAADDTPPPPTWQNAVLIGVGVVALLVYMSAVLPAATVLTFLIVFGGWIFSLTLHEFSHALVAYLGGDYTVRDKGYLTFNPLKYTHPTLSFVMPLVFLALGGIGLPGGAVYIETHRLRSKYWRSAVSAAGPAANLLLALLLSLPFITGLVDTNAILFNYITEQDGHGFQQNQEFWSAIAFLAMLQITAVFFNLLPIPPLDGFGILEPFLDEETRFQFQRLGFTGGILLIFIIFWYIDPVNRAFWDLIYSICTYLNIPDWIILIGREAFMFWR